MNSKFSINLSFSIIKIDNIFLTFSKKGNFRLKPIKNYSPTCILENIKNSIENIKKYSRYLKNENNRRFMKD